MRDREEFAMEYRGLKVMAIHWKQYERKDTIKRFQENIDEFPECVIGVLVAIQTTFPDMNLNYWGSEFDYLGRSLRMKHPTIQVQPTKANKWRTTKWNYSALILEDRSKKKSVQYSGGYDHEKIIEAVTKWRKDVEKRHRTAKKSKSRKFQKRMDDADPHDLLIGAMKEFYGEQGYAVTIRGDSVYIVKHPQPKFRLSVYGWSPGQGGHISVAFAYNFHGRVGHQWIEWKKVWDTIPEDPNWDPHRLLKEADDFVNQLLQFHKDKRDNGWVK